MYINLKNQMLGELIFNNNNNNNNNNNWYSTATHYAKCDVISRQNKKFKLKYKSTQIYSIYSNAKV